MSESKDGGGGSRAAHLDVSEDRMYDSRLRGDYELHDMAHSPSNKDRHRQQVRHSCIVCVCIIHLEISLRYFCCQRVDEYESGHYEYVLVHPRTVGREHDCIAQKI